MAFRDWLSHLPRPDWFASKGRSWPWLAGVATAAFLFLVASTGSLSAVAELVRALAALCWPALVYVVLRTYQEEIRSLLHRIRRAKPGPAELELRAEVDQLEQQVRQFEKMPRYMASANGEEATPSDASDERRILDAAARLPRLALVELSLAIEQELRRLLVDTGCDAKHRWDGSTALPEHLVEMDVISPALAGCLTGLAELSNRLVHAHAGHENETIRTIDLGKTVLRIVRSLRTRATPGRGLAEGGMEEVVRGV